MTVKLQTIASRLTKGRWIICARTGPKGVRIEGVLTFGDQTFVDILKINGKRYLVDVTTSAIIPQTPEQEAALEMELKQAKSIAPPFGPHSWVRVNGGSFARVESIEADHFECMGPQYLPFRAVSEFKVLDPNVSEDRKVIKKMETLLLSMMADASVGKMAHETPKPGEDGADEPPKGSSVN